MDSRFPCTRIRAVYHPVKGVTQNSGKATSSADNIRQPQDTEGYYGVAIQIPLIGEWLASISDSVLFKMFMREEDKSWLAMQL